MSVSFNQAVGTFDIQDHGVILPGEYDIIGSMVVREQSPDENSIEVYGLTNGPANHIFRWSKSLVMRIWDTSRLADKNMKEILGYLAEMNVGVVAVASDGTPRIYNRGESSSALHTLSELVLSDVQEVQQLVEYDGLQIAWIGPDVNAGNGTSRWGRMGSNTLTLNNPLVFSAGQAQGLAQALAPVVVSTVRRVNDIRVGYLTQIDPLDRLGFGIGSSLLNIAPSDTWVVKQVEIDVRAHTVTMVADNEGLH